MNRIVDIKNWTPNSSHICLLEDGNRVRHTTLEALIYQLAVDGGMPVRQTISQDEWLLEALNYISENLRHK